MQDPPKTLPRREFIKKTAQTSAVLTAATLPISCATLSRTFSSKPHFEISLAQWSRHRAFFGSTDEKLDHLRIPLNPATEGGMKELEVLSVNGTSVTKAGIVRLQQDLPDLEVRGL